MKKLYEQYLASLPEGAKAKSMSSFKNKGQLLALLQPAETHGRLNRSLTKSQRARLRRYCRQNNVQHLHGARWASQDLPVEILREIGA